MHTICGLTTSIIKLSYQNITNLILQDVLNFTYTLRKPSDFTYGNQKSDGSFNGMIGELERHNADMGISPSRPNKFQYLCQVTVRYDLNTYYSGSSSYAPFRTWKNSHKRKSHNWNQKVVMSYECRNREYIDLTLEYLIYLQCNIHITTYQLFV